MKSNDNLYSPLQYTVVMEGERLSVYRTKCLAKLDAKAVVIRSDTMENADAVAALSMNGILAYPAIKLGHVQILGLPSKVCQTLYCYLM